MNTNANITIYNKKYNSTTRQDDYSSTQISGVSWYTDQKVNLSDKGLNTADIYKIRIPEESQPAGKTYIDSIGYQELSAVEAASYWTIQKDDVIVKGLVSDIVTKTPELEKKYNEVIKVTSYSDNRRGSLPHWRVGGM